MAVKRGVKSRRGKPVAAPKIEPSAALGVDERREFNRIAKRIEEIGTLARSDVRLVEAAAKTAVLLERAYEELGDSKLTLETANGTFMPHPMLGVINVQTMRLRGLLADLGLTAASSKLGGGSDAKAEDKWGGLLDSVG